MYKNAILTWLFILFLLPLSTFSQGLISGRIIDPNNLSLPGASIEIKSLSKRVISDVTGNYKLLNLPNGNHKLTVTYIGFKTFERDVAVSNGAPVGLDVVLHGEASTNLKEVVVTGSTGAALKALNQQKNSNRIVNIISADQIGRFPDPNIGDALKRVPGIYVQLDQGEASLISVRGTDPSKSTININGTNMSGTGNDRSVNINAVPSDMVQTVEVTKAITPDMDGDAIGGVVNLITRKAPYTKLLSFTAGTGYSFMIDKPMANGNLVFGNRYLKNKRLGVMASASYYRQFLGSNTHASDWSDTKWVDGNTYFMPRYLSMEQILIERIRQSYTVGLDYKFNEKHAITLTGIYNDYKDWRQRYTLKVDDIGADYPTNWKRAAGYERGTLKGNAVRDSNKDMIDDITKEYYVDLNNDPFHPIYDPELERHVNGGVNKRNGTENDQKIINLGLEGQHIFGRVKVEWKGSYMKNRSDIPNSRNLELESEMEKTVQMDYTNSRFVRAAGGTGVDNVLESLKNRPTSNSDTVDTWYADSYNGSDKRSYTRQYLAQLDITIPLSEGKYGNTLRFGGKYRGMSKANTVLNQVTWKPGIDPLRRAEYEAKIASGQAVNVEDYRDWKGFWTGYGNNMQNVSRSIFPNSRYEVGSTVTTDWVSHQDVSYYGNTTDFLKVQDATETLAGNYKGEESIATAYLMSTQKLGDKLSLIGGVRMEHSTLRYEGFNYNKRLNAIREKVVSNSDFVDFMPAFHVKYDASKKAVFRFAYTRTISRPAYGDIAPKMNISIRDKTISEGNPKLKPTLSNNLDLLGEYYTGGTGLISGGIYFKNITSYTVSKRDNIRFSQVQEFVMTPEELEAAGGSTTATITDYKRYYDPLKKNDELLARTKPENAGTANLVGMELAFQRKLTFLPKPFSNFNIYANYTHNWIFTKEGDPKLPGTATDILNFSIAYEVNRFNARVSFNNTSAFTTATGILANGKGDIYYDKVYYLDANVNYFLTKKWVIYANANNLLNQAQRRYMWKPEYTYSALYTGATAQIGLKVNVF
ncbi:TonB-dependent receptor [Segetibacter sp. 3557_3]|uniref:TonB-dependent receptor n=1 Tax=Segetibacter sp. 3557_3 TaxID=2547429 RepID=UPI0010586A61|nr:TonB-dependent receptor [Segetibacter sp. 3557_3]TDH24626.1 TonB-dependent receptor [Segetibacter sp. 3557_3]